ncbi:MAG: heme A synthase [Dehalococcoidia bacterium]|nr:heme A synthase [Dehalococcoidia bacterium]
MKTAQTIAVTTCAATLILVAVGVWVRATGSGLGCPDWPLCHGGVVPPGDQGHEPIIEFTHRIVAGIVGLLVIATAIMAWRFFRHEPIVLWAATINVPLVGFQGILGAITVWRELPPEIVATHLLTAMLVLSLEALTVVGMFRSDPDRSFNISVMPRIGWLALGSLVYFAVLLWVGGYMAESGAATACEGWPLCNGGALPAADDQEITHMLHRYLAAGFAFLLVPLLAMMWRSRHATRTAGVLATAVGGLYVAQVVVGALNVWFTFPEPLTILHTTIAALLWFGLSVTATRALFRPAALASAVAPAHEGRVAI